MWEDAREKAKGRGDLMTTQMQLEMMRSKVSVVGIWLYIYSWWLSIFGGRVVSQLTWHSRKLPSKYPSSWPSMKAVPDLISATSSYSEQRWLQGLMASQDAENMDCSGSLTSHLYPFSKAQGAPWKRVRKFVRAWQQASTTTVFLNSINYSYLHWPLQDCPYQ